MKLTRIVLLEKHITFKYYSHPDKVPDFLWEQAHDVISQDGVTPYALFKLYAEFVLSPLSKMESGKTCGPVTEERTLKSLAYLNDGKILFEVDLESLIDARAKGLESLKDLTMFLWDQKMYQEEDLYKV